MHLIETQKWLLGAEPPTSNEDTHKNKMHQNSAILGDFISELSSKWKLKIHRQISHIETVTFEFQGRELFLRW